MARNRQYRSAWWTFDPKALSIAERMRRTNGWSNIAKHLYRVGFPPYEPEELRLAVLDYENLADRPPTPRKYLVKPAARSTRASKTPRKAAQSPTIPPPPSLPAPEALEETYRDAWAQDFPSEPWPGIGRALRRLRRRDLGKDPHETYRHGYEALLDKWRSDLDFHHFLKDGPVDEQEYWKPTRPRVLFILKEVNEVKPQDGDLRVLIRDESSHLTWKNVARWTCAILRGTHWDDLECLITEKRSQILSSIAAITLNKEAGSASKNRRELEFLAKKAKPLLTEQLKMLSPHLVVFCDDATGDIAGELLFGIKAEKWIAIQSGIWVGPPTVRPRLICMPHPQARRSARTMFEGLVTALDRVEWPRKEVASSQGEANGKRDPLSGSIA